MVTIYDVEPNELIERTAKKLKSLSEIEPPKWAKFVKTGQHKEQPPLRDDWWYIRTAAILRSVALYGPIGVSKLRVKYGGKKNRGFKPERFRRGSGNIIRKILQQLEKAGLVKQDQRDVYKGRVITSKGIKLLNSVAQEIKTCSK